MIDTVTALLERKVKKIHLPVKPVTLCLRFMEKAGITFPIKAEQVLRLNEDKNFDYSDAKDDFGYNPISFSEGIRIEIEEIRNS